MNSRRCLKVTVLSSSTFRLNGVRECFWSWRQRANSRISRLLLGGPCKFIAPQFEKLSNEYTSVTFAKVDVDEADDVAAAEGIQAMPTFKFYKGGQKIADLMVRPIA